MYQDKVKLKELLLEKYPALQENKPMPGFIMHRLIHEAQEMGFGDEIVVPVVVALARDPERLKATLNPLEEYVYNLEGEPCEFIQDTDRHYAKLHLDNQKKQRLAVLKRKRKFDRRANQEAEPLAAPESGQSSSPADLP